MCPFPGAQGMPFVGVMEQRLPVGTAALTRIQSARLRAEALSPQCYLQKLLFNMKVPLNKFEGHR